MESPQDLHILRVNHRDKLTDALESMYYEEALCDVTICCKHGQLVKAHRVILASCSQYFKQIFSCTTAGQYPIVFLKSITIDDLKAILEFVYKGEVTVPPGQIESLIGSAETLGVTGLGKINLHEQDFVVNGQGSQRLNGNSSSASSSPSNGSVTNGNCLSKSSSRRGTRNEQNQSAQVEIQKSVSIQALPKKRDRKRKIHDEPKVDAQIVKIPIAPTRSTRSTSKSRDSSLVRASSLSKLTKSIPPVASHLNGCQKMVPSPPPVIASLHKPQQEMIDHNIENVEDVELDFEGDHRVIQLDDEDYEQNRESAQTIRDLSRSNSDAQAQILSSPVQPNITNNGSLDLSQHLTRVQSNESQCQNKSISESKLPSLTLTSSSNVISESSTSLHNRQQQQQHQQSTSSVKQPPPKPSVRTAPARRVLNQPVNTKPMVPFPIPPNIKLKTRSGRPPKLITANAATFPRPLNPLLGLARSSFAGKIAAAAAAGSLIAPTGSPIPHPLMRPPPQPTQQAQIISSPTVPPLQITSKEGQSNTRDRDHSKLDGHNNDG